MEELEGYEQGVDGEQDASPRDEFPDEACLFIGDLAKHLTEEQLREPFEPFGVASVEIKRDRNTNCSLGYGFAYFHNKHQAAAAKKALYKTVIGSRGIRLGWAQKNTNLFIGDLDPLVTTDMLRETFEKYGPIYKEETFVKHRNYGFVRFRHRKHAEAAKRDMEGKILGSRPIRIGWGEANYQRHCVHIQFDPTESEHLTEGDIISKFDEFGNVRTTNLPRTTQGTLRGFGFIYYDDTDEGELAAANVIAALNGAKVHGVTLQCNFGKKPTSKKKKTASPNLPARKLHHSPIIGGPLKHRSGLSGISITPDSTSGGRGVQGQLYPVQVMMPVGPGGTWQPVQYMMTAHQAQQFYSSVQYNPHPQHAPTTVPTSNDSPQVMVPMYYTYQAPRKDGSDEQSEDTSPHAVQQSVPQHTTPLPPQPHTLAYQASYQSPYPPQPQPQPQSQPQPQPHTQPPPVTSSTRHPSQPPLSMSYASATTYGIQQSPQYAASKPTHRSPYSPQTPHHPQQHYQQPSPPTRRQTHQHPPHQHPHPHDAPSSPNYAYSPHSVRHPAASNNAAAY
eukprot:TRINITY_DN2275_c0_g1_i2.p1 TRINITY_DN2275_c0_g1~~TRINITY_DN2275_c0_g1_i2.p1  ORF type:complete len:561 (-),score=82.46 TRINITY_DN2275_c0_g1_i2:62-1744(-)